MKMYRAIADPVHAKVGKTSGVPDAVGVGVDVAPTFLPTEVRYKNKRRAPGEDLRTFEQDDEWLTDDQVTDKLTVLAPHNMLSLARVRLFSRLTLAPIESRRAVVLALRAPRSWLRALREDFKTWHNCTHRARTVGEIEGFINTFGEPGREALKLYIRGLRENII